MLIDREAIFAILLSLKVSIIATLIVLLLGIPVAYILAKSSFKFKSLLNVFVMLPLVFSPTITGYILLVLLGRYGPIGRIIYGIFGKTILFTWYAAVVASSVAAFPLFVKTVEGIFLNVDEDLIHVSYTLGRGKIYTFLKVLIPLSKPGIIAGTVLAFARAFGEFGATLMIAGNIPMKTATIPIEIYNAVSSGQFKKANLLVVVSAVISCGLLILVERALKRWFV